MCIATKYLNQIDSLIINIKSDMKKLQGKQSECDKEISEIYHKLETSRFNACEGYYFSKRLQDVLQKRRLIKAEMYRMKGIYDTLHIDGLNNKIPKAMLNVKKSNDHCKDWQSNFNISFKDIEEEILH